MTSMSPYKSQAQGGPYPQRHNPDQDAPFEGMFPLHRLPNICCSSGACHDVDFWPMGVPQDGWLQLDLDPKAPVPVDLIAFSTRGVTVVLSAAVALQTEAPGQLLTQAHGAGVSHRPVRCCWHRPHPLNPNWQLAGLRFAVDQPPGSRD